MNCQSFAGGYKSKHVITRNGLATIGQVIHDLVAAFAKNDQLGIFLGRSVC